MKRLTLEFPYQELWGRLFGPNRDRVEVLEATKSLKCDFEGALGLIQVTLKVHDTPVFNAVLKVGCALGNPPGGWHEGIELTVLGAGTNFNEKVSGFTLFILQ